MPEIIGTAVDLVTGVATANLKHANAELKTEAADLITENLELKRQIKAKKKKKRLLSLKRASTIPPMIRTAHSLTAPPVTRLAINRFI
jgi:hypothetical protein